MSGLVHRNLKISKSQLLSFFPRLYFRARYTDCVLSSPSTDAQGVFLFTLSCALTRGVDSIEGWPQDMIHAPNGLCLVFTIL